MDNMGARPLKMFFHARNTSVTGIPGDTECTVV